MYGCGEQEAGVASGSGWNLWVWLLGVVVYMSYYLSLLLLYLFFLQQYPYFFVHFVNVFRSLYLLLNIANNYYCFMQ